MERVCFIQDAGAASQTFRFEDDRLVLAHADARSAGEFACGYLDFDLASPPLATPRYRLWDAFKAPSRRPHARFALFSPRRGWNEIVVWGDKQAPAIVAELTLRWREARRRAVEVNFAADPRAEIGRFELLLARGIVSAEESSSAVARIVARASLRQ